MEVFPFKHVFLWTTEFTKQHEVPNKYSYHYDLAFIVILMRLHIAIELLHDSVFLLMKLYVSSAVSDV